MPAPPPLPGAGDAIPPTCQIQVDLEGELFHFGAPISHPAVRETIFAAVSLEPDGSYCLRTGHQVCRLEVADTFFVVKRVEAGERDLTLLLNDGRREPLAPATLWLAANGLPYCRVRAGAFPARFARAAYYQLAAAIEEDGQGFALVLGGRRHPLPPGPVQP